MTKYEADSLAHVLSSIHPFLRAESFIWAQSAPEDPAPLYAVRVTSAFGDGSVVIETGFNDAIAVTKGEFPPRPKRHLTLVPNPSTKEEVCQ